MKTFFLLSILWISPFRAHATGDLERAFLYYANSVSFATLLPEMEGEIAVIKMEYAKKQEEFRLQVETNRSVILKQAVKTRIAEMEQMKVFLAQKMAELQQNKKRLKKWSKKIDDVYRGVITRESLAKEILKRSKTSPELKNEWLDLVQQSTNRKPEELNSADFESVLLTVYGLQASATALEQDIIYQQAEFEKDIKNQQEYLGTLK